MPGLNPTSVQIGQSIIGTVRYPPGGSHFQPQTLYQLFILHSGSVTLSWGTNETVLRTGSAFMLIPGQSYAFSFTRERESRHSWITYAGTDVTIDRRIMFGMQTAALPLSPRLNALVNVLVTFIRQPSADDPDILIPLTGLALTQFAREMSGHIRRNGTTHPSVDAAARYMYDHLEQDLCLREIAGAAHVSPEHLVRLFKKAGHPSPVAYLWELRVGRALSLLKATGLDFTAIGLQAGFKTPFHFSRKIKEATGLSPTAYRKKYGA